MVNGNLLNLFSESILPPKRAHDPNIYGQFHNQLFESESKETIADKYVKAGDILLKTKEYERAVEFYDKALKINQKNTDVLLSKAFALDEWGIQLEREGKTEESMKRLEEAFEYYDKTTELDPKYASAWNNKGVIFEKNGEFAKAIKCFDKALKIEPGDPDALENKLEALEKLGKIYRLFEVG